MSGINVFFQPGLYSSGKWKERLQLRLLNLNICIVKVDAKCWLAEMTLVMSLPLARAFTYFSMFVYICARFFFSLIGGNLTTLSTGSHREIGGGIQIPETLLQTLLPFPAPPPECPGELARRLCFLRCNVREVYMLYWLSFTYYSCTSYILVHVTKATT